MAFIPDEAVRRRREISPSAADLYYFHCMKRDHKARVSRATLAEAREELGLSRSRAYAAEQELHTQGWMRETDEGFKALLVGSFEPVDKKHGQGAASQKQDTPTAQTVTPQPLGKTPHAQSQKQDESQIQDSPPSQIQDSSQNRDGPQSQKQDAPIKDLFQQKNNSQPSPSAQVGGAKAPTRKGGGAKEFDPRIKHPAIQAVRKLIHCLPDEQNRDEVIEALGELPDEAKLAECYRVWKKQGWNKVSVVPATEWYVYGIPEKLTTPQKQKGGSNERADGRRHGPKTDAFGEYDFSIFREGDEGAGFGEGDREVQALARVERPPALRDDADGRRVAGNTRR